MSKNNKLMGIITPSASNKKGLTHYRIIPSLAIYQIEGTNTLICGLSLPCPLLFTRIVTSKVAVLTAIQTTPMFYVGGWACYKGPSQTTPSNYGLHSSTSSNMNTVQVLYKVTVGILTSERKTPGFGGFHSVPSVLAHNLSFKLYIKMLFDTLL